MIVVTGATGLLGRLVVENLLRKGSKEIVAAVRTPEKAKDLAGRGVEVRKADYNDPASLKSAFAGASKLLLISSSELGDRVAQHKAVIDAAKAAGVRFVAYTSILHADTSPLDLAKEHLATEEYLRASGLAFSMLRNGWYYENQTAAIAPSLEHGVFIGASGEGRFAAATRADYAEAAAVVLSGEGHENTVYELGGDEPYKRAELAAEAGRQVGKAIGYHDLPEAEYEKILAGLLPPAVAHMIADAEDKARGGALDDDSHTLSRLIGRPTASLRDAVGEALKALA
ncbi:SDR family oxidoreductase [Silvibacterium acidisoli]|uniref:SDR family oxidoreductase n=1 Tax=Acidobacteriaceae bacterium ZG23-2 TaxID=2883246 RepID=UPI00406C302D